MVTRTRTRPTPKPALVETGVSGQALPLVRDSNTEAPEVSDRDAAVETYKVGYGKPPIHTRYQKGTTGNPKGRPAKSKSLPDLFQAELDRKIVAIVGGKRKRIAKAEAIAKQQVDRALKGDERALNSIIKLTQLRQRQGGGTSRGPEEPQPRPTEISPRAYDSMVEAYLKSIRGED